MKIFFCMVLMPAAIMTANRILILQRLSGGGNRTELQQKLKAVWKISAALGLENDVVISPIVIPYDEFMKYRDILPYYSNIVMEGKRIG